MKRDSTEHMEAVGDSGSGLGRLAPAQILSTLAGGPPVCFFCQGHLYPCSHTPWLEEGIT